MPEKTIRVAIVEDDDQIRNLFIELLEETAGFRCVGGYPNGEDAVDDIPLKKPDIVLMDINLPGMNGIDCVGTLSNVMPETQFVMLTVFEDNERIFDSLSAGAVGYLLKSTAQSNILEQLRDVDEGGAPMSAPIARKVVQSFKLKQKNKSNHPFPELTERELEILDLLASGLLNKEIADQIHVSIDTVKSHVRSIYSKLQVRTRTEAVIHYFKER